MKTLRAATLAVLTLVLSASASNAAPSWPYGIKAALKKTFENENIKAQIATNILKICHPSGSSPVITTYDIQLVKDKERPNLQAYLLVSIYVEWTGLFNGRRRLTVNWTINSDSYSGADVVADDAPVQPSQSAQHKLDAYFKNLYPFVMNR